MEAGYGWRCIIDIVGGGITGGGITGGGITGGGITGGSMGGRDSFPGSFPSAPPLRPSSKKPPLKNKT